MSLLLVEDEGAEDDVGDAAFLLILADWREASVCSPDGYHALGVASYHSRPVSAKCDDGD